MTIRVGLESTKIVLTDVAKRWFVETYPKGIVYEYDENEPFDLKSMGPLSVEILCPLGIPYRLPNYINDKITFKMVEQEIG